jgi:hypothetical protein
MGCNNRALLNGIEPEIVGCTSTCGANNLTSNSLESPGVQREFGDPRAPY